MDKINRANKLENVEQYRHKISSYSKKSKIPTSRVNNKQLSTNKKMIERRNYRLKSTDEDDAEDGDDETENDYSNERLGLCVTCNLVIVESDPDNFVQKPLLCHRCIKRLDSQTDANCTFCNSESQHSTSTCSEESTDCHQDYKNLQTTRTYKISDSSLRSNSQESIESNRYIRANMTDLNIRSSSYNNKTCSISEWNTMQNNSRRRSPLNTNLQKSTHSITRREGNLVPNASEMKMSYQTLECSRRPIRCPRMDCAVNVAFSALTHHFLFDHPEVPVISVDPGLKSTVVFGYSAVSNDSSRCLALLLVSDKLSENAARLFNGSQIHAKYRNRLPLPVLAARLRRKSLYTSSNEVEADDVYGEGDVIIVWIAGLDVGNSKTRSLRCSIQAVDNIESESTRSLTYTGPINSLRTAQNPRQVLLNGDCMILHEGFVNNVTSGCTNLNVNLVVH